jgi:hypothetical protein
MPSVLIDGIEYVPKGEVPELTDPRLQAALEELTSMLYFRQQHKALAQAWNVLNALAPEIARLAADSPETAYERIHGQEDV